jgi:predicted RNA-binding protein with PUA-like domain
MIEENLRKYWVVRGNPKTDPWISILKRGRYTLYGVKNKISSQFISRMQEGDLVLYFEIDPVRSVTGILEVHSSPFPDPTQDKKGSYSVDLRLVSSLDFPLRVPFLKSFSYLANHSILQEPRLNVLPISEEIYHSLVEFSSDHRIEFFRYPLWKQILGDGVMLS